MTEKEYNELIKKAGMLAIDKMVEEDLKNLKRKPPFKISKNFKKQMKKIVKNVDNNEKKC